MDTTVIGLDIAKTVFHVCVMVEGRVVERKRLYREEVLEWFGKRNCCVIGMESCGGSSYWARQLESMGFKVKLIAAQFVKPFVKGQKNDNNDAEAICEAVSRPEMRFVSPNTLAQQDLQNIHRVRSRLVKNRVMLCNQIRGLLLEYGFSVNLGVRTLTKKLIEIVHQANDAQRELWRSVFLELYEELVELNLKISHYDTLLTKISKAHPVCQQLEQIKGIGPVTSTAIIAAVNNPNDFKNGRQFSAWLGLVPKQDTTGGKPKLLGITKHGNRYLRKLLIHGGRMQVRFAKKQGNLWLQKLNQRQGYNKAAVAQANKNARLVWAMLKYGEDFKFAA